MWCTCSPVVRSSRPGRRSWRWNLKRVATGSFRLNPNRPDGGMMNAEIKPMRTAAELKLLEAFSLAKAQLPGDPQITAQRLRAFRRFEELGLPHRRIEEWKYTD